MLLEDSRIQIMTSPAFLNFLNLESSPPTEGISQRLIPHLKDVVFQYNFDLSTKINVENRTVLSVPAVFGELGGLSAIFSTVVIYIIGRY